MRNIKLTIEYDGTNYSGWQTQRNKTSIQEAIENVLRIVMNEEIELIGSGRTDSGAHALGQVANFKTNSNIKIEKIPIALNSMLPLDIAIKSAIEVDDEFHSRFSSKGKKYRYTIFNENIYSPINRYYTYHYHSKLDLEAMQKACAYFIGEHDFEAFKAKGGSSRTTIRTIYSAELIKKDNFLEFYISSNSFLYNMVRIIVGTLIYVGSGRMNPEEIPRIIESRDRKLAGKTVPANGLCLMEVYYDEI